MLITDSWILIYSVFIISVLVQCEPKFDTSVMGALFYLSPKVRHFYHAKVDFQLVIYRSSRALCRLPFEGPKTKRVYGDGAFCVAGLKLLHSLLFLYVEYYCFVIKPVCFFLSLYIVLLIFIMLLCLVLFNLFFFFFTLFYFLPNCDCKALRNITL